MAQRGLNPDNIFAHDNPRDVNPYHEEDYSDQEYAYGEEDDYGAENGGAPPENEGGDLINYKGIYFNDDPGQKFQDPDSGAHFEYRDMQRRLVKLQALRKELDKELGLPPDTLSPKKEESPTVDK